MASIDAITFDEAAYNPGDLVTCTMNYTPDNPSSVPQTFNFTGTLTDSGGNVVATSAPAPFVVNEPQPAGDKPGGSDDGNRTWTVASDTGSVATLTATA